MSSASGCQRPRRLHNRPTTTAAVRCGVNLCLLKISAEHHRNRQDSRSEPITCLVVSCAKLNAFSRQFVAAVEALIR
jgi:hypothetical protein